MKRIVLSAMTLGLLSSVNVQAAEDLSTMFSEGKASGQIRAFSISRSVEDTRISKQDYTRDANAIGGHLKFETADFKGLSFGTAFYTTNGLFNDSDKTNYNKVDPTLLGPDNEAYSILGEAYVQYKIGNTVFKMGRQKLNTPLAGSDDARMLPNLFEAYLMINSDIPNTTLIAGHVTKFAQGTFGRAYNGGILATTAGYSAVDSRDKVGDFENMGGYAVGKNTDGVSVVAASYKNGAIKAQVWDYYAHDILNAIYADASVSWTCLLSDAVKPFAAVQVINENGVGDKLVKNIAGNGDIDSLYYAAKFGANVGNFTAYVAYSEQSDTNNPNEIVNSATITPWGGMPAFTQGMVTRHMFLAGTKATKLAASYNFKDLGLKAVGYYATFDMDNNNGYTEDDASEIGFDFIYNMKAVKGLQLRLRGNFADDFYAKKTDANPTLNGAVSWSEYRFIANYNF
ncbi:OprD family porin [Sulfurimonas lithotrophica]|uniref:OprD family porin n=1 Tax=Sulfurimonas lithotrophica TaxID=2590022 RepID=A0A5P8NZP6_9BACT|nr:OprD family outer membrane porin [Sulfurimonas lithotrophica]QFR48919.1 OprD family porin [Sulfurimonas lithotrophica]